MLINADMGEGLSNDVALMPYLDMANIACAAHAGDENTMRSTVRLAAQHAVRIGAHISYADRVNFGRCTVAYSDQELLNLCHEQVTKLTQICQEESVQLSYIKPHGALYNDMMHKDTLFDLLCAFCKSHKLPLVMMAVPDHEHYKAIAAQHQLSLWPEAFVDRAYQSDGRLVPRSHAGSCHETMAAATKQIDELLEQQQMCCADGHTLTIKAQTLCIHGDNPIAVSIAHYVHQKLQQGPVDT